MENSKNQYLFLTFGLFLFFIILLILTLTLENKKQKKVKINPLPSSTVSFPTNYTKKGPTSIPNLTQASNPTLTPTPIPPTFTGENDERIPQEIIDFSKQKLSLMQQLPLKMSDFKIDFDYDNDKFIVKINPPKEENQKKFEDWLKENYPLIPKDLFIFQ